jgi:Protein of unknown function (DUF3352)
VIQDLRGHSEAFLQSPFAKKLWESPIGAAIANAPERKKLLDFEEQLRQGLNVSWAQLRDDIFGDAVVFAYRPGGPGQEKQEMVIMLVHARDAKRLAEVTERFNQIQKQSGDLKEMEVRAYRGVEYVRRVESRAEKFAYLHGPLLAFSNREEVIRKIIDLSQKPTEQESVVLKQLRRLGADQALAALWINPRAFDASFEQKAKQLHDAEASLFETVRAHWKAVDGIALSAAVKKSEVELALTVSADSKSLPEPARAAFLGESRPSDLWATFPENALLAVAGRLDAAAWNDFFSALLPADKRKEVREAANRFIAPALGKNLSKEVLPLLGPDWGMCVLAPPAGSKHWFPDTVWALRIQPDGLDRPLVNALNSLAFLAMFAYNSNHSDQITFHSLEKMEGSYLANDEQFPAGFRPAFALKEGFLIIASSPEAIGRFTPRVGAPGRPAGEVPLFRMSLKDLAQYLHDYQTTLAEYSAKKNQIPQEECKHKLEALAQVCQLFNRIDLFQRSESGKLSLMLRLQTVEPLGK